MKKALAAFALLFTVAQNIDGIWYGALKLGPKELRLAVTINQGTAKLRSLDQGNSEIAATSVDVKGDQVSIVFDAMQATFAATLTGKKMEGSWSQRGVQFPLTLEKVDAIPVAARPQEPKKPYPYDAEEVKFANLAGTLTKPHDGGPAPVVILVSGSGPQDRDETVFGHKPFLVLSDYLTRHGIAVLRVDDRGVGGSGGDRTKATSEDYADDVAAAVDYLAARKDVDAKRIGLIGHSEGGMIAPIVAARSPKVAYIVLLAAPGIRGADLTVLQSREMLRTMGASQDQIDFFSNIQRKVVTMAMTETDDKVLRAKLREMMVDALAKTPEEERQFFADVDTLVDAQMKRITSPWFRYLLNFEPAPVLRKVRVPVLALNGSKDIQVPPKENLTAVRAALAGNPSATALELEGLNHLFQTAPTGALAEYASIEETFAPKAMEVIANWINERKPGG